MTRFVTALTFAAASATCGPRPGGFLIDATALDGGANDGGGALSGPDCRPCDSWGGVAIQGPLPFVLDELSGLAASRRFPGVVYAHNDSGDTARFFALSQYGQQLAELRLPGAGATDWEDVALGPCDGEGTCIYLGDIGDNLRQRPGYTVYRVREPDLAAVASGLVQEPLELDLAFDALPFVYPGGQHHNAETLLVHPQTRDLYVMTKENSGTPSQVFKFPRPLTPGQTMTLIDLGSASIPTGTDSRATGGDIHPCGNSLLVRMYNRNVELRVAPDAGFESVFTAEPIEVPMAIDEPQGEAIAWGPDGQSFYTASELSGQSLHQVKCARTP